MCRVCSTAHPGGNPWANLKSISRGNRWFLKSTPIQMPTESGGICRVCPWVAIRVAGHGGREKIDATAAAGRGAACRPADCGRLPPLAAHPLPTLHFLPIKPVPASSITRACAPPLSLCRARPPPASWPRRPIAAGVGALWSGGGGAYPSPCPVRLRTVQKAESCAGSWSETIALDPKVGRNTVTSGGPVTVTVTEPIPCYRSREGLFSVCLFLERNHSAGPTARISDGRRNRRDRRVVVIFVY